MAGRLQLWKLLALVAVVFSTSFVMRTMFSEDLTGKLLEGLFYLIVMYFAISHLVVRLPVRFYIPVGSEKLSNVVDSAS